MKVIPHQIIRLKGVTPKDLVYSDLMEHWTIQWGDETYYIEDSNFQPLGKNSFDLMLIAKYNDSELNVAIVRGVK